MNTHQIVRVRNDGRQVIITKGSLKQCEERLASRRQLGYTGDRIEETAECQQALRDAARREGCL